jgi:hypothetical protein
MSVREKIASLTTEISALEDRAANLQVDAWALRQERDELIAQLILDEKMLAGTTWELALGDITNLSYSETVPGELDTIKSLIRTDWHSSFELEEGIELHFDDSEVSLIFKDPKQVLSFLRKNKLIIGGNKVADRLNHLKREVEALEIVSHQFNLLKGKQ